MHIGFISQKYYRLNNANPNTKLHKRVGIQKFYALKCVRYEGIVQIRSKYTL